MNQRNFFPVKSSLTILLTCQISSLLLFIFWSHSGEAYINQPKFFALSSDFCLKKNKNNCNDLKSTRSQLNSLFHCQNHYNRHNFRNIVRYASEIKEKSNTSVNDTKDDIQPKDIVLNTDISGFDNIEMDEKTKRILQEISESKKKRNEAAERLEKGWKKIQESDKRKMEEVVSAQEVTLKILEKRKGDIEKNKEVVEQLVDELENSFQSKLYRLLEKVFFLDLRRAVAVVLVIETIYISYLVSIAEVEDSSIILTSLGIEAALGLFYAFLGMREKAKD